MRENISDGVLIVGGGLAGLSLAAALRALRFPAEVVTDRLGGRFFDPGRSASVAADRGRLLWTGALAALDRIGIARSLYAVGTPIDRIALYSGNGRLLLLIELGGSEPGPPLTALAVRSSALAAQLRQACGAVPIHTGLRAIGYTEDDHGVLLTLDGGGSVRAPVIVGADGAASAIRAQCLDDGPVPFSGDTVWEGIGPNVRGIAPGTLSLYWGPYDVRAGAMTIDRDGATAWWVDQRTGVGGELEGPRKPELRELIAELRGPIPELVEATPAAAIRRADVRARRRSRVTGQGRVALIGDAGHPVPAPLRLGGTLAVEDAAALAESLAAERADPVLALRRYERQRIGRLTWTTETLWRLRALETRYSPAASRARDAWLRRLPAARATRLLSRLAGADGAATAGREKADVSTA